MTAAEFLAKVKANPHPVVVDVWAPWCAPCRMITPALERLEATHAGTVELWKINADDEPELTRDLGVMGIPTLIAYRGGEEVARHVGAAPEIRLRGLLEQARGLPVNDRTGIAPRNRVLRLGAGVTLAAIGLTLAGGWPLILAGAALAFSGVYDHCPVWQAIAPRFLGFVRGKKVNSPSERESGQ